MRRLTPASVEVEPAETEDRPIWSAIDVLRAGLLVAGVTLVWIAVSERRIGEAPRTAGADIPPLVIAILIGSALATGIGFPARARSLPGSLARFVVVVPVGAAMALGAGVGFANAFEPSKSDHGAAACVLTALAIFGLGIWPRRSAPPTKTSAFMDALIGGGPLVWPALAGAAFVEAHRSWVRAPLGAIATSHGLALATGVATALAMLIGARIARGGEARRWVAAIAPAVAILAALVWMQWMVDMQRDGSSSQPYATLAAARLGALDRSVIGVSGAAVWAALLLAGAAVALGARAYRAAPRSPTRRREAAVLAALVSTLGVYAFLLLVRLEGLSTDERIATYVAAVPAALATVGVWLAAAGADSPDPERAVEAAADLMAAAGCGLGALALAAFSLSLVDPASALDPTELESILGAAHRQWLAPTAAHAVPLLVATLVALPRRILRPAFARSSTALAAFVLLVGLPPVLVRARLAGGAAEIHAAWGAVIPPGVRLAEEPATMCDFALEDVVFVGEERVVRAGRELGAAADLDADAGCAVLAAAIDGARAASESRWTIAPDADVSWSRLECMARALASRPEPTCRVTWLASHPSTGGPACMPSRLVGGACRDAGPPQGKDASFSTLVLWTREQRLTADVVADPRATPFEGFDTFPLERGGPHRAWEPIALAATPEVSARVLMRELAAIEQRHEPNGGGVALLLAGLEIAPGAAAEPPQAGLELRLRVRGAPAPALDALHPRLLACFAEGPLLQASDSRAGAIYALITEGKLERFFVAERSYGAPGATSCMRDVLLDAPWPTGPEALVPIRYDLSIATAAP